MLLLSSDICRHLLQNRPATLLQRLQEAGSSGEEVVISAITYAELIAAAMLTEDQARHTALVKTFCERLDAVVPWDTGAVDAYSSIQVNALAGGYSLNMNDAMLAAHALSLPATLLTLSEQSFQRVEGLELELWKEEEFP